MKFKGYKIVSLAVLMAALISGTAISFGAENPALESAQAGQKIENTYWIETINSSTNKLVNNVDGYGFNYPNNMEVDMSFSGILASLTNLNMKIEVYKQTLKANESVKSYFYYSNMFINNTVDHNVEYQNTFKINGKKVQVLQWSRNKLKNIENDKNYYASVDIVTGNREVYTFLFKADAPFWMYGGYMDIIQSFYSFQGSQPPYMKQLQTVENEMWDAETAEKFSEVFVSKSAIEWGIFEPVAMWDFSDLKRLETRLDFKFPILLYYSSLSDENTAALLVTALSNAYNEDRLVELTLQTIPQSTEDGNMVYDVLEGKYDGFLKRYAGIVSRFGHPVLFRLCNEMNGDWCEYSAYHTSKDTDVYKAFYKYIYKIFEEAGADNVIWVWNPHDRSYPDYKWNDEICYYPGDEYVDVIGLTGYNNGVYYPGDQWRSFSEIYDTLYKEYDAQYNKPMMITEFSCSSIGGSKEYWVQQMFERIESYEKIKAAIWWDGCDFDQYMNISRPYFIDDSTELMDLFMNNLK